MTPAMAQASLRERFSRVRTRTLRLCAGLSPEDQQIQAFDYASPTKWHLAHTTWFFDTFLSRRFAEEKAPHRPGYDVLFNSYYEGVGERFARAQRGLLSRPSLDEVCDYRSEVDDAMLDLLDREEPELNALIELGLAHEEQHQELLLTDLLANFSVNPLRPVAFAIDTPAPSPAAHADYLAIAGGLFEFGHRGDTFAFDNESPRHRVYVEDFLLRTSLVSNAEVIEFMDAGGYRRPELWLADGIAWVREQGIEAPAYWRKRDGEWTHFSLHGELPLDPHAPVTHLSAYEADAIATFFGARLPTEFEWELAASTLSPDPGVGRFLGSGPMLPLTSPEGPGRLSGLWGEAWQWTRSAYAPYPGFSPSPGAVGEYNGKFMSSQWVLRGGSCVTPPAHVRTTYRNFFYPQQRWQFTGLRLAKSRP